MMELYSTSDAARVVSLEQAVIEGLAPDNGLYMPRHIPRLNESFFKSLRDMSFADLAFTVAKEILQDAVPADELRKIVDHTIAFDAPLVEVSPGRYALELFHGPTLAFKDFGARFMSRMLAYFAQRQERYITILVATSGDTGSAVANGFLGVEGTRVVVLYPSGKVSEIQEKQFTTLGQNITAVEVKGTFDDCQMLVKKAFLDNELKRRFFLTSANSINIARLIPQSFYYFRAWAQLKDPSRVVFAVPSGNFGNLTAGLIASRMGLPVHRFIAATNRNDVVPEFFRTRVFSPRSSVSTISNAMDVGNPSNFARMLELYGRDFSALSADIHAVAFSDEETRGAMRRVLADHGYLLDPHGAIGWLGLEDFATTSSSSFAGIFLETAHPAKFKSVVEETIGRGIEIPEGLARFMKGKKQAVPLGNSYDEFREFLISAL